MAKKELPAAPAAGSAQKTKKRRNRKPKSSSAAAAAAAPLAAVDNGPAGNEFSAVTSTDTPHYPQARPLQRTHLPCAGTQPYRKVCLALASYQMVVRF
eukprot:826625-Pleurochrysis_carterae.AAC.10